MRYPISIYLDACNLRGLPNDDMTLNVEDTAQVEKDYDSGFAAIIFALTIARGRVPQTIHFTFKLMSRRSIHCFEDANFKCISFDNSSHRECERTVEFPVHLFFNLLHCFEENITCTLSKTLMGRLMFHITLSPLR